MDKFTKEQQVQAVYDLKVGYTLGHADIAMLKSMARQLLASMEREPVAWLLSGGGAKNDVRFDSSNAYADPLREVTPLYAAPQLPQPAVPGMAAVGEMPFLGTQENAFVSGWNACRATMLQGADGKPELTVWYGAMPETNGKTNWTAMLHRKGHHPWEGITIDRSEYPGRVRYEADRMRHLIGELADKPDILAYDSDAHSGYVEPVTTAYKLRDAVEIIRNSGIEIDAEKIFAERDVLNTPDCWCRTCRPVTVTDMRFVVCPDCGNKRCPHANDHRNACTGSNEPGQEGSAYPAAPQQEVKAALKHGMQRYAGAMQKLSEGDK